MKSVLYILLLLSPGVLFAQKTAEKYPVDSASVEHAGIPKGEILKFTFQNSKIYPGTWREYFVYVPAEYDGSKPACVFVDQDGIQFKSPTVFDNLIYRKEMPVTIGVYVTPGRVLAKDTTALDRYNRSFEFDGLGDAYARFLLEELLPDVEKHTTTNGRPIFLSHNGNDRMIAGTSSGAVCAFNAAWERPDAFSRVFSGIGTYVSLRGADHFPGLIRKYEPKPIKVFLQDGANDLNIYGGDWFYANQMMERALTFAGYQVNHAWGDGAHSGAHSTAIFAEAMRWLWKGYPEPATAGKSKNAMLNDILVDSEGWRLVKDTHKPITKLYTDKSGFAAFGNLSTDTYYKADYNGKISKGNVGDVFHARCNEMINGPVQNTSYLTGAINTEDAGKIFFIKDKRTVADKGLNYSYGLALTPDHSQLYATESNSHWVWLYTINPDGTSANKQRYGWLHSPDTADSAQPRGIQCDRDGRVYVATSMGIQVLDQAGRVNVIIPLPLNSGPPTHICFGGADFSTLYVVCGSTIYSRKLKVKGLSNFDKPIKPVKPKL